MKTRRTDIFREIKDGEDVSDIVRHFLIWVAAISIFVAFVIWLVAYPHALDNPAAAFLAQLERQAATPEGKKEWQRLIKKHGRQSVIVYEPGQAPYYKCGKNGKEKCKFI